MILDRLGKELIYFDGGTGTLLQERGLKPGELPETWSLERADDMIDIARQYYEAGSDIVLSNTFGANALKFHDSRHKLDEIVKAAIENVRKGAKLGVKDGRETYVGLDIGPTGKLLKPMGDLDFEDAYQAFAEVARLGEEAGASTDNGTTMTVTEGCNVRAEANSDSDIIGGLDEGTEVTKTGQEGDWIQIDYEGQTGYVYSGLLQ